MIERVCVVGAGTIGSLFAGHLAQVVPVSVLTRRRDQAEALNASGLRITGRTDLDVRVHATDDPVQLPDVDLAIVACKTTDLEAVASALAGKVPRALVMTVQNGLGAEAVVGARGEWPLVSAITFMSGTRRSDTEVEYVLDTPTWLGPYGDTPLDRVEDVVELIVSSGLRAEAFADLLPAQWSKLIFNATVNAVSAVTGLPHDFHFAQTGGSFELGHLVRALMDEGKAVATAASIGLHDDPWEMNVLATQRGSTHHPSMLEDVRARRPTELEWINGALLREAERLGVSTPLHETLYALVEGREASYS